MHFGPFAPAVLWLGLLVPACARPCLSYEPATTRLTGTVTLGHGFGPPGFGEDPAHDRKEAFALLTLAKPVCVKGGQDATDEDVAAIRAFQLVSKPGEAFDRRLFGRQVTVTGTLFHRVSGGNTEVMMRVEAVAIAK